MGRVERCLAVFRPSPAPIASRTLVSAPIQDGCSEKMKRAKTSGFIEASEGSRIENASARLTDLNAVATADCEGTATRFTSVSLLGMENLLRPNDRVERPATMPMPKATGGHEG